MQLIHKGTPVGWGYTIRSDGVKSPLTYLTRRYTRSNGKDEIVTPIVFAHSGFNHFFETK